GLIGQVRLARAAGSDQRGGSARDDLVHRKPERRPGEEQREDQQPLEARADLVGSERDRARERERDEEKRREERGHSPSFFRKSALSAPGLPLPFSSFIAWPTKKPSRFFLPALYFSTSAALRARTASATASSAAASETCARPFSLTICAG